MRTTFLEVFFALMFVCGSLFYFQAWGHRVEKFDVVLNSQFNDRTHFINIYKNLADNTIFSIDGPEVDYKIFEIGEHLTLTLERHKVYVSEKTPHLDMLVFLVGLLGGARLMWLLTFLKQEQIRIKSLYP